MNRSIQKAYTAALSYSLIIGFSFVFVKMTLESAHPLDTLAHRFTASFAAGTLLFLLGRRRLKISAREMLSLLPLAMLYPIAFFAFQVFGLEHSTSSEAGILQAVIPILTMFLASYFLGEKASIAQKIGIAISVAGVIYIFAMKGVNVQNTSLLGAILILISALSSAGYNVLGRKLVRNFSVMDMTYVMSGFGFLFFNILSLGRHMLEGTVTSYFAPLGDMKFLIAILYLGVISSLLTSFLTNYALTQLEASKMSVFSNFSTLLTMVAGAIILNEQLYAYHIVGAVLIIGGILCANFLGSRRTAKQGTHRSGKGPE